MDYYYRQKFSSLASLTADPETYQVQIVINCGLLLLPKHTIASSVTITPLLILSAAMAAFLLWLSFKVSAKVEKRYNGKERNAHMHRQNSYCNDGINRPWAWFNCLINWNEIRYWEIRGIWKENVVPTIHFGFEFSLSMVIAFWLPAISFKRSRFTRIESGILLVAGRFISSMCF